MDDDQQFCLRWNNHQSTLIQNFDTLLERGTLVDCTLAAEGKYLMAHKVVLSACSPYFEGLLSEHYDKHPVFILKDVKFKELEAMMNYMYRGEVNISQDQLTALLKAAESLQIKGLSDSKTGGSSTTTTGKSESTRSAKTASSTTSGVSSGSVDIPHTSSGLSMEKINKVPRQSLQQVSVSDLPDDSASPQLRGISSREGSQSPSRKRKRIRRRSVNDDTSQSMENHEASNSSDVLSAPSMGAATIAEDKTHADPAEPISRSALMQQLTKQPADEMLQIPLEKPEPSEEMIQPKSEYVDDQESVEDLTHLDDDMNDLNEMEDNSRAGPSHDPSQHSGIAPWHISGDRSSGSVVTGAAPGAQDDAFLVAHEAAQAQRDSQDTIIVEPLKLSNIRHMLNDIPIFDESNVTLSDINNESHDTESLSVCEDSCFAAPWKDFNGDEDGSLETMDIETEKFFLLDNNNQKDKQSIRETGNQTLTPSEQNLNTSKKNAFKVDYALHCEKCEKTFVKVPRKKMTKCKNCKKDFFYDCLKCSKRYVTLTGVYLHHKLNKCPGLPNFDKISVQTKFNVSRKRSFSFKNFYSLYCGTCKKTFNKIPGKRLSKCPKCKKDLMYDCINCTKRYISIPGLYLHIKLNKCPGVQGFNQINFENKNDKLCKDSSLKFLCAHCNFSAKQKGNLLIHINRKHMPRKCQVCNEEFETYDRYKTHRQERCFKVKKSKEEQKAKKIPDNENYKNEESKSYAEKLKSSENSTTGNRKFQCAHCFYKAYREEHLVRHVYDNHNFEP